MKVDLKAYFKSCPYEYCILRMPKDFPSYKPGSDLDILCTDLVAAVGFTCSFLGADPNVTMRLTKSGHTHVNVITKRKLNFRFDFIDTLQYTKFTVNKDFRDVVMAHRVLRHGVWVPGDQFDLALRYMEYIEHPRKVQHLYYVEARPQVDWGSILKRYTSL